jgi:hypothetical protein
MLNFVDLAGSEKVTSHYYICWDQKRSFACLQIHHF